MAAGQYQRDRGPLSQLALYDDRAARLLRKAVDLRQAEPGALADRLGGEEWIEDFLDDVRRDAAPGITQRQLDMVVIGMRAAQFCRCRDIARGDGEAAALRHRIARIDRDVEKRELQLGNVEL